MDNRPQIVVVEDEATQRRLLVDYLERQSFRVSGIGDGTGLRRLVERELPALVLLDVGLPGEDGFALARWLREKSGRIGIIMVTAASDTVDRVVGLETGADDYIGKPYEPRELLARIKSVLRRSTGAPAASGPRIRMGRRVLDLEKRVLADPADGSEETLECAVGVGDDVEFIGLQTGHHRAPRILNPLDLNAESLCEMLLVEINGEPGQLAGLGIDVHKWEPGRPSHPQFLSFRYPS